MLSAILWYIIISLLGLATFPIAYKLLPGLPDRGYAISRTLGWLMWGYAFWLLWSLNLLQNDAGGLMLGLVVLLGLSALALRGIDRQELKSWLASRRWMILTVELLFLAAFAGWAVVRAANPEANYTEKPMEMAFINAFMRSPTYPPHDPWLSGYAISYYYFGYVLVAMLAELSGTAGSVAFNLGGVLVFALSAVGAYGVVYDILGVFARSAPLSTADSNHYSAVRNAEAEKRVDLGSAVQALLGPVFILFVSNLEGFLEVLHARWGSWTQLSDGKWFSPFWSWLGILDLNAPPSGAASLIPNRVWWWWRASRVVSDYTLKGGYLEIIDEFPFFSYLLADLHPHVLAMPFMFLAVGLALNLYLTRGQRSLNIAGFRLGLSWPSFALLALTLGGMSFLNTWDILAGVALFGGAYALAENKAEGERMRDEKKNNIFILHPFALHPAHFILSLFSLVLPVGVTAVLMYLPFYLGFSSQAGGAIPNLVFVTRGAQFWVMFAPLLLPIFGYLAYLWWQKKEFSALANGILTALGFAAVLWLLSLLLTFVVAIIPAFRSVNPDAANVPAIFLSGLGADSWGELLRGAIERRFSSPGTWVTLVLLLGGTIGFFTIQGKRKEVEEINLEAAEPVSAQNAPGVDPAPCSPLPFLLLLVIVGSLLTLGPEFLYLRDQFGTRINTIFKFYYQAWLVWGVAAAVCAVLLLRSLRGLAGLIYPVGLAALLGIALVYPAMGLPSKTNNFDPPGGWTLDGGAYMEKIAPNEWAAIQFLKSAPLGTLAESIPQDGGQYSEYARVAEYSGQPGVLGWIGHESQWRGGLQEVGTRQPDLTTLYITPDWNSAFAIIQRYHIRYIIVGPRERSTYRVSEQKFKRFMGVAFQAGDETVYEMPAENP